MWMSIWSLVLLCSFFFLLLLFFFFWLLLLAFFLHFDFFSFSFSFLLAPFFHGACFLFFSLIFCSLFIYLLLIWMHFFLNLHPSFLRDFIFFIWHCFFCVHIHEFYTNKLCISILYALKKLVLSKRKILLCNKDINVNLYQLNFPSFHFFLNQTEKFYIPLLFHPFNQTQIREIKISSIPPLFYPLYFLPFYFFTPPTK